MGNFTNENNNVDDAKRTVETDGEVKNLNRRRFSRNALAGSAVLLSLGNRSAWGGQTMGCMSVNTLNSFDPVQGMFISAPAQANGELKPEHNVELAKEIHRIASPPDYLGTDGTYSTCPDPDSLDGVCVVKGNCP